MNYLNHGSKKQDSEGFSLDTVKNFDKVLSSKKYSLLQFTVETIRKSNPSILKFVDNYKNLGKAVKCSENEFESKIKEYKNNIEKIKAEIETCQQDLNKVSDSENMDPQVRKNLENFVDYFQDFLTTANRKMDEADEDSRQIKRVAVKCREIYGLSKSYDSKLFLNLLHSFIEKIKQKIRQIEKKEADERRKQEIEQKRRKMLQTNSGLVGSYARRKTKYKGKCVHFNSVLAKDTKPRATTYRREKVPLKKEQISGPPPRGNPRRNRGRVGRNRRRRAHIPDKYKKNKLPIVAEDENLDNGNLTINDSKDEDKDDSVSHQTQTRPRVSNYQQNIIRNCKIYITNF